MRLAIFHGQFGLKKGDLMCKFLNGERIEMYQGVELKLDGIPTKEGIEKFMRSTKRYHENENFRNSVEKRIKEVDMSLEDEKVSSATVN